MKVYIYTAIVGVVICFGIAFAQGIFNSTSAASTFRILCDSFFVVAVLLIGFGFMTAISSTGFFNIFGYAKEYLKWMFLPARRKEKLINYYDYKQSEAGEKHARWHIVIIGVLFFVISMVFLWLESAQI